MTAETAKSTKMKGSVWVTIGFWVTVGYILFVAWLAAGSNSFVVVKANLSLNEFADAAAGLFAPLAFLWLFVATMVQSGELALQREELQLTRQEFVQNRAVAKEQAEEARNQARFIGTQTEITIRAEADRHLVAVLDSLKELLMQSFQTQIVVRAANGDTAKVRGIGQGNLKTLGGLVDSVRLAALELRDTLKTYPDRKVSVLAGPLLAFREIVQEIKTLLPSISPAQTAVLSGSNFNAFLAEADYLLSVCGEGS